MDDGSAPEGKKSQTFFKICDCSKKFHSRSSYHRHKNTCAPGSVPGGKKSQTFFKICACSKEFHARSSYYRHKKTCPKKHVLTGGLGNFVCREEECNFKSNISEHLIRHLHTVHNINCNEDENIFNSLSEFEIWKEEYEKETKSSFVRRSIQKSTLGNTSYFYCNRSGAPSARSVGKRSMKSKGISKIGFNCPARLVAFESVIEPKTVQVKIRHTHYGHDCELAHLRIPKKDRDAIALQLSLGVPTSEILTNALLIDESGIERKHLCTKRDLLNIRKAYGIEIIENQSKDHLSVDAYVHEILEKDKSILLYKRQGEKIFQYPEEVICTLEKNDFVLCIMTNFQKEMLRKFGNDIICVDAAHDSDKNQFHLISIFIVDEFREGIPIAWLISNKENATVLKFFFQSIKKEIGNVMPQFFISHKAPLYYNAWKEVFKNDTQKLLCHWHVHQHWLKNLKKIKNMDLAESVYNILCLLLEESDAEKFEIMMAEACEHLETNSETRDFHLYFKKEWIENKHEWATCFRKNCGFDTNIFLESFHKVLKNGEAHLKGKQGERIDKCLHVLLEHAHDSAVKRSIKLGKGKNMWKLSEINKRHKLSLSLPTSLVNQTSPITWNVRSERYLTDDTSQIDNSTYIVEERPACTDNCQIICQECKICLHSYSCTCPDALTGTSICKHIHLVHRYKKTADENSEAIAFLEAFNTDTLQDQLEDCDLSDTESLEENTKDKTENFETLKCSNNTDNALNSLKTELLQQISELHRNIQECNDINILQAIKQHIDSAISS